MGVRESGRPRGPITFLGIALSFTLLGVVLPFAVLRATLEEAYERVPSSRPTHSVGSGLCCSRPASY